MLYDTTYKYYKTSQANRQPFTFSHRNPSPMLIYEQRYRLGMLALASGLVYCSVYSTSD